MDSGAPWTDHYVSAVDDETIQKDSPQNALLHEETSVQHRRGWEHLMIASEEVTSGVEDLCSFIQFMQALATYA